MSPILLRPIREQFEHNRVIRLLQIRLRRRYQVGVNIEDERESIGVRSGTGLVYPDLVLTNLTGARRLHGVAEVETTESVNYLEAMAEWRDFGKVRGAFYLYVPAGATDIARRLCEAHGVAVTEIWSYHAIGDQMRFTMAYRSARAASRAAAAARRVRSAVRPKAKTTKRGTAGATQGETSASRRSKTSKKASGAKRSSTHIPRTGKSAKRAAKSVGRSIKTTATTAATAKTSVGKATRAAKKTVTSATRRVAPRGKASSRATGSASKSRTPSTGGLTKKTAVPSQLRKK